MAATPKITPLTEVELQGKITLVRADLNVPIAEGKVTSDARLRASLPSVQYILEQGGGVLLCSHLGRPTEGEYNPAYSLAPIAALLEELLQVPVPLVKNWQEQPPQIAPGQVALLENVRFCIGETDNAEPLARQLARLCDVFVMDAFGTAHRAHASTCGAAYHAKVACSGLLVQVELEALERSLTQRQSPVVAVVGGSKVSTKLEVLLSLAEQVDCIIPGGGIANTFLLANGVDVGRSLCEPELVIPARHIQSRTQVLLPEDVLVGKNINDTEPRVCAVSSVDKDEAIFDIGTDSCKRFAQTLLDAKTIIWNGPMGVFEQPAFAQGTQIVAQAISDSKGYSLAGGGDTIAAIDAFAVRDGISYISTAGGAFLEYLEGRELPGIKALKRIKPLASY